MDSARGRALTILDFLINLEGGIMSTGPKSGWGGKRPGAGRPNSVISKKALKPLSRALRTAKKTSGKDIFEILVGFAYDETLKIRDRLLAIRTILDALDIAFKAGEKIETEAPDRGKMWLPPMRPDPAKIPLSREGKA
jgi:hypothetical protein